MQFTKSFMLLAALTTGALALPANVKRDYNTNGFGASTASSGDDITYKGNVGSPWGSNIIEISANDYSSYKHTLEITGQNSEAWQVVFWNKYGPDGLMDGWWGNSALTLTLNPGETKYVAFDDDTNGGFAAGPGSVPNSGGQWASTWGEFDFGSTGNSGWSGFDVSAIVAQNTGSTVQGMQMCDKASGVCSTITPDAALVDNAYTTAETDIGGIGGNISGDGQVQLTAVLDYQG